MITNFKKYENCRLYESETQYRELDLSNFFKDINKYKQQLNLRYGLLMKQVRKMLIGKKVEFLDDVMRYKTSCTPNEINYNVQTYNNITREFLSIYCIEDKNTRTFSLDISNFIRIYNSEETAVEKELKILKNVEKYNL